VELLSVADDGTTVVRLTDAEAHALRNVLPDLTGSATAHALQRHLAMAHGEIGHRHDAQADRPVSLGTACTCTHALNWHGGGACTVCACRKFTAR
jgi:hypothetical protein